MQALFTDHELETMPLDQLDLLINAAYRMLDAHKNWYQMPLPGNWCEANVTIDGELTAQWGEFSTVYFRRIVGVKRCWKAVFIAIEQQKQDQDHAIQDCWEFIARLANLNNTANLDCWDIEQMKRYTVDRIWDNSDQPSQDVRTFESAYKRARTNKSKILACQRWARVDYRFGIPEFRGK